jgi:RimJ/RimL family protein N-acetyltransferase
MLTTPRLVLVPITMDDAEFFYGIVGHPVEVRDESDEMRARTVELREVMELFVSDWERDGFGYHSVRLAEAPDEVIGIAGLRHYVIDDVASLNICYYLRPDVYGRGIAFEATQAAIDARHAYGAAGELPVVALIPDGNEPSQQLAEKLGLRWEPGRRDSKGRRLYEL